LSCKYHDPKAEGAFLLFERWAAAMTAAYQNSPTESEFRAVAAVVHGRLWVEKVQHTTTAALINAIEEDIIEFCPELVKFVRKIFSSAAGVDARTAQEGKV
jgi:hypothetical protein